MLARDCRQVLLQNNLFDFCEMKHEKCTFDNYYRYLSCNTFRASNNSFCENRLLV